MTTPESIENAQTAKQSGMARVDTGADPAWKEYMLKVVHAVCLNKATFTSDDIFNIAEKLKFGGHHTHDRRAFGPVMTRAAKAGWCVKANVAPVQSNRSSLHASPRAVWTSLIYTGAVT